MLSMLNFKRSFKDWLSWLILISVLIIVIILCWYFNTQDNFEKKSADWGDFGSLLGAIAGLIAFIGVLFTLKQSKQQFLNSEERSTFFELLKIFISYRDSLRVQKVKREYNNQKCEWNIIQLNELCMPEETYQQIYFELYHSFYLEIRKSIPENFSKKEEFLKIIIPSNISISQSIYDPLIIAIDNIYKEYSYSKDGNPISMLRVPLRAYNYLCVNAIKIYLKQHNFKPIANAYARAGRQYLNMYKNKLDAYFNNTYNILDMVSSFTMPTRYFNIFRTQLSKNELAILFFYSFSPLATPKTRKLYLEADLFKNLDLRAVRLKEEINNKFVSRETYEIFPFILDKIKVKDEYVSYDFLKEMYDCVDTK